ncbi:DUF2190 family protein [Crenothrix polyspora]|uniref:Putative phage-related exported protein n=1 Tax=Crenothrix polyspora TaxID=360316 RepID=A0A1R4HJH1_9GAMM|nr:DUF2190 family protein [Crenothrix polyspora]SJM96040.1 putative phage-related exported protein [Crenothrix polyspora]
MSQQARSVLSLTITALTIIPQYRIVTPQGFIAASAGIIVLGVTERPASAGELVAVTAIGTAIVEAGGAISQGSVIAPDGIGRAVAGVPSVTQVGIALQSAAAAGDLIEVLLS